MRILISYTLILFTVLIAGCGGGGSSSDSSGAANEGISGQYKGTFSSFLCNGSITMNLSQSGTNVSGNLTIVSNDGCGTSSNTLSGSISGNNLSLTDNDGDSYSLVVSGNKITGTVDSASIGTVNLDLTKE